MIEVTDLSHHYGSFQALKNVSFKVPKGEVAGLLGLNGAGKTTCIRIMTGYLIPSGGSVTLDNLDVFSNPMETRGKIGYLPETPPLYPELTVTDFLRFVGRMRGIPEEEIPDQLNRVIKKTNLQAVKNTLIRKLSLGFKKRTGIAQALIGSPPLIILDEPVSGLDPRQIVEMRTLIRDLAGEHTVLLSSHILSEVTSTCDMVLIIHEGKLAGSLKGEELNGLESKFMELTSGVSVS